MDNLFKNIKVLTLSLDEYNKDLKASETKGMQLVINAVLDLINNDGKNIKTTNEDLQKFFNFVKTNLKEKDDTKKENP